MEIKYIPKVKAEFLALEHEKSELAANIAGLGMKEFERMAEGQEQYGKSWAQVNLRADLLEEISDILNYVYLMYIRVYDALGYVPHEMAFKLNLIARLARSLNLVAEELPAFAGPTSAEWVKRNKEGTDQM